MGGGERDKGRGGSDPAEGRGRGVRVSRERGEGSERTLAPAVGATATRQLGQGATSAGEGRPGGGT